MTLKKYKDYNLEKKRVKFQHIVALEFSLLTTSHFYYSHLLILVSSKQQTLHWVNHWKNASHSLFCLNMVGVSQECWYMTPECELTQISRGTYPLSTTHTYCTHLPVCFRRLVEIPAVTSHANHPRVTAAERVTADHRLQFNPACYSSQVVAELLAWLFLPTPLLCYISTLKS